MEVPLPLTVALNCPVPAELIDGVSSYPFSLAPNETSSSPFASADAEMADTARTATATPMSFRLRTCPSLRSHIPAGAESARPEHRHHLPSSVEPDGRGAFRRPAASES